MKEPFLTVANHHVADCGEPPRISDEGGAIYVGYFENQSGEQWVFTYDRRSRVATLRGGDAGWDESVEVINGRTAGMILDPPEAAWLRLCWAAAVPRSPMP